MDSLLGERFGERSKCIASIQEPLYCQIPGLREGIRVLSQEGLLWVKRMEVSAQAVSKRLQALPIELFAKIFEQVMY